jgi:hypothetical protein
MMSDESNESLPFQPHSGPSRQAAFDFKPHVKKARRRVFDYIEAHPRSSDQVIQCNLPMNANTQRPRRIELQKAGLVRAAGLDGSGKHTVYEVTGKPYPTHPPKGYWRSFEHKHRSERPTPEEMAIAVETMRKAWHLMGAGFPEEAIKVYQWLDSQTPAKNP